MAAEQNSVRATVLVLSRDVVGAALLGGLIELLGYTVRFPNSMEAAGDAIRRTHPRLCMIDCDDSEFRREDVIARGIMRGICTVILYGSAAGLAATAEVAERFDLITIRMPPSAATLREAMEKALRAREQSQG